MIVDELPTNKVSRNTVLDLRTSKWAYTRIGRSMDGRSDQTAKLIATKALEEQKRFIRFYEDRQIRPEETKGPLFDAYMQDVLASLSEAPVQKILPFWMRPLIKWNKDYTI